jgi:uncharacterized protein YceK
VSEANKHVTRRVVAMKALLSLLVVCAVTVGCSSVPKVEAPKVDAPKVAVPKVDAPKVAVPKVDAPKVAVPKVDAPKVTVPKVEISK